MIALAVAISGCSSGGPKQATPTPPAATTAPSPSADPGPASEIKLAFAGDVHFIDETLPHLNNPQTAFGAYADLLRAADFAMVNLETAITERGVEGPKRFHFRAPPVAYAAVKAAGIDLVSIANNHTLDYGEVGLIDTLDFAKLADMPVVGAGLNVTQAYEPYVTTVRGIRVGVVALSQVWELAAQWKATATKPGIAMAFDKALSVAAVKKAKSMADIVVVYLHWGTEDVNCPNNDQKMIAKALADAGAHILVGTHSHVPHGDGYLGKTYVHYGLGNFLWARSGSKDTLLLNLTVRRDGTVAKKDFVVGVVSENGQPVPVTGAALAATQQRLAEAAKCTGLAPAPA
ncbi:capsular polysaccharide biosynthesis protein [Rhizocola hellebori]|uniref:Capsular polysaccharide biosynthesis protein n=2 Tax=Rhizocola hellebori TaxID=1392758 RepID=A0A8J3VJX0_9ACTN|nr:capsular polysaccharide biosynthesis protein [Rhizocola hellebori]